MCVGVDIFSSCLGVNNLLTAVKAEVAREHVRYAAGKREVQQFARAEQLDRQDDRRYRAVYRAAEHRDERDRRRELRRYAKQRPDRAAEDRTDEHRRHYLAALKAETYGNGGESYLP